MMSGAFNVAINLDASALTTLLESLSTDLVNRGAKVSDSFIDGLTGLIHSTGINLNVVSALGTGDVLISLEVTDCLLDLIAAARAGDFDVV